MNKEELIGLRESSVFSNIMLDYIEQNSALKDFYSAYPSEENILRFAQNKADNFAFRDLLFKALDKQYQDVSLHSKQAEHLTKLKDRKTVTITTGHQLNLFTGPVFFFYKILQTIKMCDELNGNQDEFYFVPMYWMATEDHDFEEINHFYFDNRKFVWEHEHGGAVGQLKLDGIEKVFQSFLSVFPASERKNEIEQLIQSTYCKAENLTQATRFLVQELFGHYGLLALDGDDKMLKELMIPIFEKELIQQNSFDQIEESNQKLEELGYKIQVQPREINLFYLQNNSRERIVKEGDVYKILNTNLVFTEEEILADLHQNPEKFSPNVVLRPVYQEVILPNVAYIGGGGEIAYWLQLKSIFEDIGVDFPLLFLRNSLLIKTEKQHQKQEKLNISNVELFLPLNELIMDKVVEHSELLKMLKPYENQLIEIFDELESIAAQTDKTFANMLQAQRTKQLKGFNHLQKRLKKAERLKSTDKVNQLIGLNNELFPNHELQERYNNFSTFWLNYGSEWIEVVYETLKPFEFGFQIKTI